MVTERHLHLADIREEVKNFPTTFWHLVMDCHQPVVTHASATGHADAVSHSLPTHSQGTGLHTQPEMFALTQAISKSVNHMLILHSNLSESILLYTLLLLFLRIRDYLGNYTGIAVKICVQLVFAVNCF